jgi:hypothetical protein
LLMHGAHGGNCAYGKYTARMKKDKRGRDGTGLSR